MSRACGTIGVCHFYEVSNTADLASIAAPVSGDRAFCGDPPRLTWRYDGAAWVSEEASAYAWLWAGFDEAGGGASEAWPIGSVFTSAENVNPAVSLGFGTWELIATGVGPSGGPIVLTAA